MPLFFILVSSKAFYHLSFSPTYLADFLGYSLVFLRIAFIILCTTFTAASCSPIREANVRFSSSLAYIPTSHVVKARAFLYLGQSPHSFADIATSAFVHFSFDVLYTKIHNKKSTSRKHHESSISCDIYT